MILFYTMPRRGRKFRIKRVAVFLFCCWLGATVLMVLCYQNNRDGNQINVIPRNYENVLEIWRPDPKRMMDQLALNPPANRTVFIYAPSNDWVFSNDERNFQGCTVKNCHLTTSLTSDISRFDAIVFRDTVDRSLRKIRPPDQIWIWFKMEGARGICEDNLRGVQINWTAAYRLDSDIPVPYGYYVRPEEFKTLQSMPSSDITFYNETVRNYASGKTKHVAWFVSNCFTRNGRLAYAKELAKYIPVDIYGRCGDKECARDDPDCWRMLETDYRFYLAFENRNAKHYITEKLFDNALK